MGAKVRPTIPATRLVEYLRGQELVAAGDLESGAGLWQELADQEDVGPLRCWLYLHLGDAWFERQGWEKAHAAYRSALEAAREPVVQVAVWGAIGRIYKRQSDFDQAEASFRAALRIYEETWSKSLGLAHRLTELGTVAWSRSRLDEAAEHYQRALEIQQELAPDSLDAANSLNNLGIVAGRRGQLEDAEKLFQRALTTKRKVAPDSLDLAASLGNLCAVALKRGQLELAAEHYQWALTISQRLAPDSLGFIGRLLPHHPAAFPFTLEGRHQRDTFEAFSGITCVAACALASPALPDISGGFSRAVARFDCSVGYRGVSTIPRAGLSPAGDRDPGGLMVW